MTLKRIENMVIFYQTDVPGRADWYTAECTLLGDSKPSRAGDVVLACQNNKSIHISSHPASLRAIAEMLNKIADEIEEHTKK